MRLDYTKNGRKNIGEYVLKNMYSSREMASRTATVCTYDGQHERSRVSRLESFGHGKFAVQH